MNLVNTTLTNATITTTETAVFTGATAGSCITLGNVSQSAGVLTAKINTGILNAPTVFTTPAPATSIATGVHTLTAANFANGFIVITASSTNDAVTMPAKSVFITLFGANRAVGDTFIYRIHNASTTVNQALDWTAATGATVVGQIGIQANAAVSEEDEVNGTSTGTFMARLTNVDGSTIHYRLS